jgi:hypothetical protein
MLLPFVFMLACGKFELILTLTIDGLIQTNEMDLVQVDGFCQTKKLDWPVHFPAAHLLSYLANYVVLGSSRLRQEQSGAVSRFHFQLSSAGKRCWCCRILPVLVLQTFDVIVVLVHF